MSTRFVIYDRDEFIMNSIGIQIYYNSHNYSKHKNSRWRFNIS